MNSGQLPLPSREIQVNPSAELRPTLQQEIKANSWNEFRPTPPPRKIQVNPSAEF